MLRKTVCLLGVLGAGVLWGASLAVAQPDPGPGMAAPDPQAAAHDAPPVAIEDPMQAMRRLNNPADKLELFSPEATVRSFVWAWNKGDLNAARECVIGALPHEKLLEWENDLRRNPYENFTLISDLHSFIAENRAVVTFRLWMTDGPGMTFSVERLRLVREGEKWRIIPDKTALGRNEANALMRERRVPGETEIIEDLTSSHVAIIVGAEIPLEMRDSSRLSACQSNLKQIALGVMQFLQDFDEKFDLHEDWKNQLQPYLKSKKIFRCPEVKAGEESYSFNSELENKFQANLNQPAQIIMLYEGKDKKFDFRHRGGTMTNIAFGDGHVKAYSKQALEDAIKAGTVRWQP